MSYWDKKLVREQLDKKLEPLKVWSKSGLHEFGWIKVIRQALGMSTSDLAKKVGIDQSRISRLENAEVEGNIKLSSLHKIADALNMEFVYGFVPRTSLNDMVQKQAHKIAVQKMKRLDHTMRLELQELTNSEKESALKDMIDRILIEEPKDFWKK